MSSSAVSQLCTKFWAWRMKNAPEFATFCGNNDYDDQLQDFSLEAFNTRQKDAKQFLDEAKQIEATPGMNEADKLNVCLLIGDLETYTNGIAFEGYLYPVNNMENAYVEFEQLQSWMAFKTVEDYKKYNSRLKALVKRCEETEALLDHGISKGKTASLYSMKGVLEVAENFSKAPENTMFYEPYKSPPSSLNEKQLAPLKQEAITIIQEQVTPAFAKFWKYLKDVYFKKLRPVEGISSVPEGAEFYEACLKWHLSLDMTPQQVHDLGKQELARIRTNMDNTIKKIGFEGDFKAFVTQLRTDPKFVYDPSKDSKEELMKEFRDMCDNKIRPVLPKLFRNIPESALIIKPVPESRPNAPLGYYLAGTLDGSRPGTYYVNAWQKCTKSEMMALSLHEGEPGHHFQGMYAIETKGLPDFRRYIEDMNYWMCPSNFSMNTAYLEGWGLYCEFLGEELGLYDTDLYSLFGRYSFEIHRACRLVVDTGLHAFGWTYEQAVELFTENTSLSAAFIDSEVRRYITWPGQACAYKVGELKLKELRKKAEVALGDKSDVRDFHEEVLKCGAVPLTVLEHIVDQYIERTKAS